MKLALIAKPIEEIAADALLLPVDGRNPRLGGGALAGIRAALAPDDRMTELEYLESQLQALGQLGCPESRVIDGVARWRAIVVTSAYPHNANHRIFSPLDCARMIRAAMPSALREAGTASCESLSFTMVGTSYRMTRDLAARALADGLASARNVPLMAKWSLPNPADLASAEAACLRLGLVG